MALNPFGLNFDIVKTYGFGSGETISSFSLPSTITLNGFNDTSNQLINSLPVDWKPSGQIGEINSSNTAEVPPSEPIIGPYIWRYK